MHIYILVGFWKSAATESRKKGLLALYSKECCKKTLLSNEIYSVSNTKAAETEKECG